MSKVKHKQKPVSAKKQKQQRQKKAREARKKQAEARAAVLKKDEKELKMDVIYDEGTGVFTFKGTTTNITEAKNCLLEPYNKRVHNYGVVLEMLPTEKQKAAIHQNIGNARFIRNEYITWERWYYEISHTHLPLPLFKASVLPFLKEKNEFLKLSDKFVLESAIENAETAYKHFFKDGAGFPKYASSRLPNGNRFTTKQTNNNIEIAFRNNDWYLKLPKIGSKDEKWIKVLFPKNLSVSAVKGINTRILKATVKRDGNRYYVSLGMESIIDLTRQINVVFRDKIYSADVGIKSFAVWGNERETNIAKNPRWIKLHARRLRRKQKALSRKVKGSKNYEKARLAITKEHKKCKNQRKDYHHKLSRIIANKADVFICEDLNINGMLQNPHLAKEIASAGWAQFLTFVKYKVEEKGGIFLQVGRYFPSSKLCHSCGYKYDELTLDERIWTCPKCQTVHDRDKNAKINILDEGIRILRNNGTHIISRYLVA